MSETSSEIWRAMIKYDTKSIEELVERYRWQDTRYRHPIVHEAIEQSGGAKTTFDSPCNVTLRWLLTHRVFGSRLHDRGMTDAYGNTAYERMASLLMGQYCQPMRDWLKTADFGLGKEVNQHLHPDNFRRGKFPREAAVSLNEKFPEATLAP
jgi:hypothetical protein